MTKNELDKQTAKALPVLSPIEISAAIESNYNFIADNESKNYMLWSKEISYFTIFEMNKNKNEKENFQEIVNFISTDNFLTKEIGFLKLIETNENFIEVWIGETHFALFPCDDFFCNYLKRGAEMKVYLQTHFTVDIQASKVSQEKERNETLFKHNSTIEDFLDFLDGDEPTEIFLIGVSRFFKIISNYYLNLNKGDIIKWQ